MILRTKRLAVTVCASALLAIGVAVPGAAAQQSGLVNINIEDVNVDVIANINAAAAICGLQVGVLAQQLEQGPVDCVSRAGQDVTVTRV